MHIISSQQNRWLQNGHLDSNMDFLRIHQTCEMNSAGCEI